MPEESREAAEAISRLVSGGAAPAGSLRVFGDWFGRPHDNWHRAVAAHGAGSCLTVLFDGGEVLRVWDAGDVTVSPSRLLIGAATRVRWEWLHYGKEQAPASTFTQEHRVEGDRVVATSTASWYEPSFEPSLSHSAVELG